MAEWNWTESRLRYGGRCYTLRHPHPVRARHAAANFTLAPNVSYTLALHTPGQQAFMSEGVFPLKMTVLENVLGDFGVEGTVQFADIHIEKKVLYSKKIHLITSPHYNDQCQPTI